MDKNRLFRTFFGVGIILSVIAVFIWAHFIRIPLPCLFYRMTGLLCPTCGATRAVICITHGEFARAYSYNPFVTIVTIPSILWLLRISLGLLLDKRRWYTVSVKELFFILTVILIFIIWGITRNF